MSDKKNKGKGASGKDDLAGFREFLEGESAKRVPHKSQISNHSGFELLSFLEIESDRLDKHSELMARKSAPLKSSKAYEELNKQINREIAAKNAQLMKLFFQRGSPMMKSLEDMARALFGAS